MLLAGDIGSTFTKMVGVSEGGELLTVVRVPTDREDLAAGVFDARDRLLAATGEPAEDAQMILSSSAGGGLRVAVLGLEPALTLAAGLRASAGAGARIVAAYGAGAIDSETASELAASQPDIALLTGGTDGGDDAAILGHAEALRDLMPGLPVVVAGNRSARDQVKDVLGNGRVVRWVDNVMPRVGEVSAATAQTEIQSLFVDHVIGHGRFASTSQLGDSIKMPTPAAVLAATRFLAERSEWPGTECPVVVDVGGATTDVHSDIPLDPSEPAYVQTGLAAERLTRTVEGDLGLRENAPSIVEAARREAGGAADLDSLVEPAARRARDRAFVPDGGEEGEVDRRLAAIAVEIAVLRHAGRLRTIVTDEGASMRKDGRDLRKATCLVATGGIFSGEDGPENVVTAAIAGVREAGGLVPAELPVLLDRRYLLWAVGLLSDDHPEAAGGLLDTALGGRTPEGAR
jgi:uncharacterized protein (TIGR01319 family)